MTVEGLVSATRSSSASASGSGAQSSCSSHSHWTGSPCGNSGISYASSRQVRVTGSQPLGRLQIRQIVGGEFRGGADGFVDGGAESGAAGEVQHTLVPDGLGEQLGGIVRAAGVGADDVLHRALLAEQAVERVGQPAGTVMGDDHGGDDVPRELWGGSCV